MAIGCLLRGLNISMLTVLLSSSQLMYKGGHDMWNDVLVGVGKGGRGGL
jgi:hypothetical protein